MRRNDLTFELASLDHAKEIVRMRQESAVDLTAKLGPGHWGGSSKIASIRERVKSADPETLRRTTLYVASLDGIPVGSVAVSTFPPGFWKKSYWEAPVSPGLGVFALVVSPGFLRQGIGRFLMDGVEGLAQTHKIPFVRLDAYSTNPISTAFYRSIGYQERAEIILRSTGLILFEKRVL